MKLIMEYTGTVSISGNNVPVAGYLINDDPGKLAEGLSSLVTTFLQDSSQNSQPVDNPAVMLSIELGPLTVPPSNSGNSVNGGTSPSPMTTASATPTRPVGTTSPPSSGKTGGNAHPSR